MATFYFLKIITRGKISSSFVIKKNMQIYALKADFFKAQAYNCLSTKHLTKFRYA